MYISKVLVANTGDDSLTLIDLDKDFKTETIFLSELAGTCKEIRLQGRKGFGPFSLICSEDGNIIVTNSYDNSVMKIDLLNKHVLGLLTVGKNPTIIQKFQEKIYVVNTDSNSISVIDDRTFTHIEDIAVGEKPMDIQIDREGLRAYVPNGNCNIMNIFELNSETMEAISIGKQPIKIILEGKGLYILSYINNGVMNISNLTEMDILDHKIKGSIDLKGIFDNFVKLEEDKIFYLSSAEDGYIYRIEAQEGDYKNIKKTKVYLGGMPSGIKWDGGTKLYITNILKDKISIIDILTNQTIKELGVGKEPNGILLL